MRSAIVRVATCLSLVACAPDTRFEVETDEVLAPLELLPCNLVAEGKPMVVLGAGDPIQLVLATQGGQVMYVGARARGMAPGPAELTTRLVEPETGEVWVEDGRGIEMIESVFAPGWLDPWVEGRGGISHLLACPDYSAADLIGRPFRLEIELTESRAPHHAGAASVLVTPTCSQLDATLRALCECECSAGYYGGKCAKP